MLRALDRKGNAGGPGSVDQQPLDEGMGGYGQVFASASRIEKGDGG